MGNAVGLHTVVMTKPEATFGSPLAADRAFEINSESLDRKNNVIPSDALRGGARNLRRGSRRVIASHEGAGDVVMQVVSNGMGRWFQQALGGVSTIAQVGSSAAWIQTHMMGSLAGISQTVQKQVRDQANTVVGTFTFPGTKVTTMELALAKKSMLIATFGLNSKDVVDNVAAASPTYPNAHVFHFQEASLTLGGTATAGLVSGGTPAAGVSDFSVKLDNKLALDEYFIGSGGTKSEPQEDDYPTLDGKFTARFSDPTVLYDVFAADAALGLNFAFQGALIGGGNYETLIISIPEIHLTGEQPKASGPKVIEVNIPFEAQYDGTNVGMRVDYQSSDTAI